MLSSLHVEQLQQSNFPLGRLIKFRLTLAGYDAHFSDVCNNYNYDNLKLKSFNILVDIIGNSYLWGSVRQTGLRWLKTSVFDETWQEPNPSQPCYWTYWRRTMLWEVPQSGSEEEPAFAQVKGKLASRGNNVYVLDFKHFCPVRKSRCKGMFPSLQDLTGIFFFLPFFSQHHLLLGAMMERQRMFELNMRTSCFWMCFLAFF